MELRIFETAAEAERACAQWVGGILTQPRNETTSLNIALSGGSSFLPVYDILSIEPSVNWGGVHIFFCDERSVPPEHPDSNFGSIQKRLLEKAGVPAANIHRMMGENNPGIESIRYSAEIEKHVPMNGGVPQFDLVLLGVGEDGHTASIFPGNEELLDSAMSVAATRHPIAQQGRVTLTGRTLLNAKKIVFLVTGEHKAKAFSMLALRKPGHDALPAGYFFSRAGDAVCFADRGAFQA